MREKNAQTIFRKIKFVYGISASNARLLDSGFFFPNIFISHRWVRRVDPVYGDSSPEIRQITSQFFFDLNRTSFRINLNFVWVRSSRVCCMLVLVLSQSYLERVSCSGIKCVVVLQILAWLTSMRQKRFAKDTSFRKWGVKGEDSQYESRWKRLATKS